LSYGAHGYTHYAVEDLSIIHALPNLDIYSPNTESEVTWSLDEIILNKRPAYLRLGVLEPEFPDVISLKGSYPLLGDQVENFDGVICWTGSMGRIAFEASKHLRNQGRKPLLISIPALSLDSFSNLFEIVGELPLLTLEEHTLRGGFGSMVLEFASNVGSSSRIKRIGIPPETNNQIGSRDYLLGVSKISSNQVQATYNLFFN
jgi:transketolase